MMILFSKSNILIRNNGMAALCDFGHSMIGETPRTVSLSLELSGLYMAPELHQRGPGVPVPSHGPLPKLVSKYYSRESDVFAFAMAILHVRRPLRPSQFRTTMKASTRSLPRSSRCVTARAVQRHLSSCAREAGLTAQTIQLFQHSGPFWRLAGYKNLPKEFLWKPF